MAVLTGVPRRYCATKLVHHGLHPVADAKHREVGLQNPGGYGRRALVVHAGRAAGKDDPLGVQMRYPFAAGGGRNDLRVDLQLADAPGDQVRILGAEIDNRDGVGPALRCS